MPRLIPTVLVFVAALLAVRAAAFAECTTFAAHGPGEGRVVQYSDLGKPGASVSDMMVGRRMMFDENGNRIGTHYWLGEVEEVDGSGAAIAISWDMVFVLNDGVLFLHKGKGTPAYDQQTHGDDAYVATRDKPVVWQVVGGLEAYAGAKGTVSISGREGNDAAYDLELDCE